MNDTILSTNPTFFKLNITLFGADLIRITLNDASLAGRASIDQSGLTLNNGYFQGYLTQSALLEFVEDIKNSCSADEPPSLCGLLETVLGNEPHEILNLLISLLGGYDTIYSETGAAPCPEGDSTNCNAISLCTFIDLEATQL